jgi:hypothetical protein
MARLLVGLLIFIGLPLLSRGVLDISTFLANPARLGYVTLAVLTQTVVVLLIPRAGEGSGSGKALVRQQ